MLLFAPLCPAQDSSQWLLDFSGNPETAGDIIYIGPPNDAFSGAADGTGFAIGVRLLRSYTWTLGHLAKKVF